LLLLQCPEAMGRLGHDVGEQLKETQLIDKLSTYHLASSCKIECQLPENLKPDLYFHTLKNLQNSTLVLFSSFNMREGV
jgi:hypothetical protein